MNYKEIMSVTTCNAQKKPPPFLVMVYLMVGRQGLEPRTKGFRLV